MDESKRFCQAKQVIELITQRIQQYMQEQQKSAPQNQNAR
jgi:hypothetical protein